MKNFKMVFGCLSLFLVGNVLAQPLLPADALNDGFVTVQALNLPNDGSLDFTVLNISQENEDAEISGANAGDTLRYEVSIKTLNSDLIDFETIVDISDILIATDIIDAGLGEVVGNNLIFPAFSQSAPCEKIFSFFVKVKEDCGRLKTITANSHGIKTNVNIECDLPSTGSSNQMILLISFLVGVIVILGIRKIRV
jgi:LPXTG-motif cell wall-anchored protein